MSPTCLYYYLRKNCAGHTLNFTTRPHNLTTNQSSRVEFHCTVRSTLIPIFFKWNFTRKGLLEAETIANKRDYSVTSEERSQVLIINSVQWRHEGVYTCIVSSGNNQIEAEANLNVFSECTASNIPT